MQNQPQFRVKGMFIEMPERKDSFSVGDRKKLDSCLCMRCKEPTCLMLDGKCCKLLMPAKPEIKKTEERK